MVDQTPIRRFFNSIKAKTDNLPAAPASETTAAAAVLQAQAAANLAAAINAKVDLFNSGGELVFPEKSDEFVLIAEGAAPNVFNPAVAAEIVDNNGIKLSSKFAASAGYITEVIMYAFSVASETHILELSYGAGNIIGIVRAFSDWTYVFPFKSKQIPLGAQVKYRIMAQTALASCRVSFRYVLG